LQHIELQPTREPWRTSRELFERHCSLMASMESKACVVLYSRQAVTLDRIMVLSAVGIGRRMTVSETPAS
jgi:hypothetical protein